MPITALDIENFKGIEARRQIELRPITVFVGPNSSGKSSCIHALALLSQSLKLPNNLNPLAIDEDRASVHLGRFIDVLHSKSYVDHLVLGVSLSEVKFLLINEAGKSTTDTGTVDVRFWFKCVMRTQEILLDQAEYRIGSYKFEARPDATGGFKVKSLQTGRTQRYIRSTGFLLDQDHRASAGKSIFNEFWPFYVLQNQLRKELLNTRYLGPFRQAPSRKYPTRGVSPTEVGPEGESATTLLANEVVQKRRRTHIRQIAQWLSTLGWRRP